MSHRLIIAGSRDITDPATFDAAFYGSDFWSEPIDAVIHGGARGVDAMADAWAREWVIHVEVYPADWKTHGRAAGPIRNRLMASKATSLLAIWDGVSPGTASMIREARAARLIVEIYRVDWGRFQSVDYPSEVPP